MRIVCPDCQAAYEVPDPLLVPGKSVRCAKCGREWAPVAATLPLPPPREIPPPVLDEPKLFAEPRLPAYRARNVDSVDDERLPPRDDEMAAPRRRGALLGWIASLIVVVALLWLAFAFRGQIMAAWPPSERVYGALGMRGS